MRKSKILIVEDERIIAEDIRRTLLNFGYDVTGIASSGVDALNRANEIQPHLVLMDIVLDGNMSGVETAEEIRKIYNIPVIYLTAYADDVTLQSAKVTGPYGYILKPFEERELHTTIEMAFYKHKMERALQESETFMKNVIDTDPNMIFVKDHDLKYVMVNKSMSELYELPKEKMIGKTDLDLTKLSIVQKHEAEKYRKDDLEVIDKKRSKFILEQSFSAKGNKIKWFQTTKVPLSLENLPNGLLGVAVEITQRKYAEEELKKSLTKLERILDDTINCLIKAVEVRDPYTAGHQRRVSDLACLIAKKMKLLKQVIDGIRMASLVHDIGKIYIPAEILSKPGKLTDAEFNLIKIHPQAGYDILIPINFTWPVAEIVLQHQERYDGSSYPKGLKGDEIKLEARILAVADTIEAMASHRPYRPALGIDKALEEIELNRGILYDPVVADACLDLFNNDKFEFPE